MTSVPISSSSRFCGFYWLLPSSSSSSSSSSTSAAWRLAWEPSRKKTFFITPDLGARIVCCRRNGVGQPRDSVSIKGGVGGGGCFAHLHLHGNHDHEWVSNLHFVSGFHQHLKSNSCFNRPWYEVCVHLRNNEGKIWWTIGQSSESIFVQVSQVS